MPVKPVSPRIASLACVAKAVYPAKTLGIWPDVEASRWSR
jgi:hypothetical protein